MKKEKEQQKLWNYTNQELNKNIHRHVAPHIHVILIPALYNKTNPAQIRLHSERPTLSQKLPVT
jgi:hypothetical protein